MLCRYVPKHQSHLVDLLCKLARRGEHKNTRGRNIRGSVHNKQNTKMHIHTATLSNVTTPNDGSTTCAVVAGESQGGGSKKRTCTKGGRKQG